MPITPLCIVFGELPPLKPVKVSLDGIPSLQGVSQTTQLGVTGKLAEGALNATVCVSDKVVKQHQSQHQPLRNAIHAARHLDIELLTAAISVSS